jgi:hypothetical protein
MKFRDSLDILTKRKIPVPTGNGVRDESFHCVAADAAAAAVED